MPVHGRSTIFRVTAPRVLSAQTSDVVVGLTGVSSVVAVGLLGVALATALTGAGATSAVGNEAVTHSQALTGVSATTAPGAVASSRTRALTGLAATAGVGTTIPSRTIGVTGLVADSASGSVAVSHTQAVLSASATAALGSIESSRARALTGLAATSGLGAVPPSRAVTVTGLAASVAPGSVATSGGDTSDVTRPLSGIGATGAIGMLTAEIVATPAPQPSLGGHWSAASVESLFKPVDFGPVPTRAALRGTQLRARVGRVQMSRASGLAGATTVGAVGQLAPSQISTIAQTLLEDDALLVTMGAI